MAQSLLLAIVWVFLAGQFCVGANADEIVINVPSLGPVRGTSGLAAWNNESFYKFYGIPYGESTSGPRRFKLPVRKRAWGAIFDATREKNDCPSAWHTKSQDGSDVEDCLHLSVFSKNLQGEAPVMVVLHGEMWFESEPVRHPPEYLMSKNIVLVVPSYRTGVLGFLSTLSYEIPGNVGAFDAALALEWVKEHIRYFGGDSSRVTLVGQSGGAVIAHALSISPKIPQELFHRVILQSGTALSPTVVRNNPIDVARDILAFTSCGNTTIQEDLIEFLNRCFMSISVSELIDAGTTAVLFHDHEIPDNIGVKLTINDSNGLLPEPPEALIQAGYKRKYPMIAGVTKHDGVFAFDDELAEMQFEGPHKFNKKFISYDFVSEFLDRLGVEDQTGALKNLFRLNLMSQSQLAQADMFYLIPDFIDIASVVTMKSPILKMVKHNVDEVRTPTYLYTFDYKGQFTRFGYGDDKSDSPYDGGVCHNDENIFLFPFPQFASKLNTDDTRMAQTMVELWTSFAEAGVPHSNGFPTWKPFLGPDGFYLKINRRPEIRARFYDEFFITAAEQQKNITLLRTENRHHLAPRD